uniref:poly(A)-specific ribonuclease n=1 Tax=Globodera pallida TaxID=36090 RepID=A0A183BV30_GLOPA
MRDFIDDYPFVAMDTEYPGVIATPVGQFRSKEDFNYQQLRLNVDCLKLIQEITLHDVWANNLEAEFAKMRDFIDDYPFVAMDTEYPGVIATPVGQFRSKEDFNYQQLRLNVDCLKLIQVGFTLTNEKGQLPPDRDIFQFNLHFDPSTDSFAHTSLELLKAAGFDFNKHQTEGIKLEDFGELLTTSGLVVEPRITWLTFHSCFDFGYLIRAIMLVKLPEDEKDFFRFHRKLFPNSFDIKILLRQAGPRDAMLKGGLQELADQLHVPRIGQCHQAGSDSLLTAMTFFKLQELFFAENWKEVASAVQGHMAGLSNSQNATGTINSINNNGLS